ncbi:MAG: uroporphyrinogen decarboxylase family protein [Agathobacter sp.]
MEYMLNAKENARKLFLKQTPDYIPKYGDGIINNVPINGYHERPEGGQGGKDWFGVEWTFAPGDMAPMPSENYLFEDVSEWRDYVVFPDLDAFDWEAAAKKDRIDTFDRDHHLLSQMIHNGVFERLHTMMGFENALCALLTDPEECKDFFDACADWKCRLIDKLHQYYNPDIIVYHDDWGSQQGMLFAPEIWSELIKPATRKIAEHTRNLGIFFELHSCGKIKDIVPELVEDVKPDAIQLMALNDIPELKKITGNKVVYDVFVDVQKMATMENTGKLTEEWLRKELKKEFETLAQGGCYLPSFLTLSPKWQDVVLDEFDKVRMQVYR